jgi:hypothetical protein
MYLNLFKVLMIGGNGRVTVEIGIRTLSEIGREEGIPNFLGLYPNGLGCIYQSMYVTTLMIKAINRLFLHQFYVPLFYTLIY